ncbi:hypothetical protein CYY_000598 [Polysphondylium violaceum]|uniref:Uncharacterized protein n=1 Tax=Polysphondylium violaceum TaxID=133409 RepID=A0A8J4Q3K8_9MYCE|nr:hypothetical protein CYY_000598 [Polysphondylium violaceum]
MKVLSILALLLMIATFAFARPTHEYEYRTAFTNWMVKHSRTYSNHEFQNKYAVFKKNVDFIAEWNAQNSGTVLGLTTHADLSNEEYKKMYLGTKFDASHKIRASTHKKNFAGSNPTSVDWRAKGAVTGVKNQGQCGSCWSFSASGATEGAHEVKTGNLVALSEQQLIDCSSNTKWGNDGCNGGLMDNAFKYIIANGGLDTEASYPYTEKQGKCKFNPKTVGATLTSYTDVPHGSESDLETEAAISPVSIAIDASLESFQLYQSGVYYDKACSSTQLDHGVLVVGYGSENGSDYWIVKNSWGEDWGQSGYILMARNKDNACGVASMASRPIA